MPPTIAILTTHGHLKGELLGKSMDDGATYNGEIIPTPLVMPTLEQQLALLDWHSLFTGRYPNGEMPITQTKPPRVYWD